MDHTRERFIPWLAVITADSQEGQMFERRWRGKILNQFLLRFNCRRRTVAWHLRDLVLSSATLFLYFIILPQHPFPTSILIYSPIFRCFFCTFRLLLHLFLSLLRFFFLFYSLSRSLSTYLFGGLFEDEQLDVETRWTIVQLFARRGASASRSARVQFEKKVKFVYVDLPTFLVRHSSLAY